MASQSRRQRPDDVDAGDRDQFRHLLNADVGFAAQHDQPGKAGGAAGAVFRFARIASAMPSRSNTFAICAPLAPPPTGFDSATDFAASMARLKLRPRKGPASARPWAPRPRSRSAPSARLPATILPRAANSLAPGPVRMRDIGRSPSATRFSSTSDGPRTTSKGGGRFRARSAEQSSFEHQSSSRSCSRL